MAQAPLHWRRNAGMGEAKDPAQQLARELAREVTTLPASLQLWLFEWMRAEVIAVDADVHRADQLNADRSAKEALEAVAAHLGLEDEEARLAMTMRDFDAAPKEQRRELNARLRPDTGSRGH